MDGRTIRVITEEVTHPKPPTIANKSTRQLVVTLPNLLSRTTREPVASVGIWCLWVRAAAVLRPSAGHLAGDRRVYKARSLLFVHLTCL